MFDIALLITGCLVFIILILKAALTCVNWYRRRPMRQELDRRGIPYNPYDGQSLELTYYRVLKQEMKDALKDPF
ncbi:hypothetical protein [Terasakiella pusilla]|uniref:hypothetical protein n=1 Tax=Terasakiella pusilla TaxID=64973 RepID=UPI003AA8964E